ncbi:MAG: CBS domain-containing protein, partial [Nitrospirae bacterium]|nr:CBS domain-containing protein [Nitrospirota bacterium]
MIIEDVTNFLKNVPPFQFLEEGVLVRIASHLTMEFCQKNNVILSQDGPPSDALRIIKKGGVKVSMKTESGEEVVIDYRGEGDTFGFLSMFSEDRQRTTIVAVDDTLCYLLNKKEVMRLLDTNPSFTEYFLKSHFTKYIHKTFSEMHNKIMYYGGSSHFLFTTRIGDLATKKVIAIHDRASIQESAQIMVENKISSLIITDDSGLPCGIITDKDLREKVVAKNRDVREPVKNIMSLPLIRVDANDYFFEAVLKMIKHNIHHVIIVKDGVLSGVITNHDLMILQGSSPLSFVKDI